MEGTPTRQQQESLTKKEPLRVRSVTSLRQHEQQQVAASLASLRGHGLLQQQRQLLLHRESQRTPVHPQKPQCMRPSLVPLSKPGVSSGGVGATVKFTPNVAVKSEQAAIAKTADSGLTSSGFGIEGLLLRSLHNRESTHQQNQERFGKPKPWSSFRQLSDQALPQQRQSTPLGTPADSTKNQEKKNPRPRSIRLSELAHGHSQGQFFLPITIPFKPLKKQHQGEQHQEEAEADESLLNGSAEVEPQHDLEDIDTAASTPNSQERKLLCGVKQETPRASPAQGISLADGAGCSTASLLRDQFLSRDTGQMMEEDERPEFLQLCFPELFPPLDILAMQARQCADEKPQQSKGQQQSKTSRSSGRSNAPTPLQALPSGRIGQLLIRRSGRVHLRLLTDASLKMQSRRCPANPEEQQNGSGPAPQLRNGDISYDVLVGTEGSFAQEVGCLLSDTNEFIFVGKCPRKLIATADIPRAIKPLDKRNR
ncbi:hypothetical protein ACSSS7_001605 [Eimeria intestinalis]